LGDDAEVRVGGVEELGPIAGGEVAAISGAAEQRGELTGALAEHVDDGGKLLGEEEEAHSLASPIVAWQEIRVRSVEKHFHEWFAELQVPRLRSG
jgi:hypothetical protein